MSAADLRNVSVQAIRLLLAGELQLCNSLYRFLPSADLENRVATLEQQMKPGDSGAGPAGVLNESTNGTGAGDEPHAEQMAEELTPSATQSQAFVPVQLEEDTESPADGPDAAEEA